MTDWQREIEIELRRAEGSTNPGRLRTVARRIAGIAIQQLQKREREPAGGSDYMSSLRFFLTSVNIPSEVAAAAQRLEARLSADFTSQSVDPVGDAMLIVEYVKMRQDKNNEDKNNSHNTD